MMPSAVLSVLVTTEGVGPSNAKLNSVQSTLKKTAAAGDTAGNSVARAGAKMEKAGASISKFGKAATKYVATPLLAAAGASLYFAQKYEKSMLLVQTHTDTSRKNLALYKKEILEMSSSGKYTQGPAELGEAMYHIASDGYTGAKAMDILRKSADLAMVGQSGMAETTYAVVSAIKNQITGAKNATEAIGNLNAIMGAGDTKMSEVTGSMSTGIIPAAKQMGLSFEDVGAALDLLTQRGVPAQQGAYRLAMTFQMLIPHTEKAEEAFSRLGLKNMALVDAIEKNPKHGLLSAMELLEEHLTKIDGHKGVNQIQDIEEIFGGGRTSRGAISMLQNLKDLGTTYQRIEKLRGETPKKIEEAKAAEVNKFKQALVQLEAVMTELGMQILPMAVEGLHDVVGAVMAVAHTFDSLPTGVQGTILKVLALVVALAFLIRIIGFFTESFGKLLVWFGKTEVACDSLIACNDAAAVSYGEVADAAVASAAEQTAAIEEVAAAAKVAEAERMLGLKVGGLSGQQTMASTMPLEEEGAQMSLFGTAGKAASTAEAGAVAEDAGAVAAGGFASSFMAAVPGALAAAAPVAAVAIPVAVTGVLAFQDITAGPEPTRFQKGVEASHRHIDKTGRQAEHFHGVAEKAEGNRKHLAKKEATDINSLVKAEHRLQEARKGTGPYAGSLFTAEIKLDDARRRLVRDTKQGDVDQKKHGLALDAEKHKMGERINAISILVQSLKKQEQHIEDVVKKEKEAGEFEWKGNGGQRVKNFESIQKSEIKAVEDKQKAVEQAEQTVGKKWAQQIAHMSLAQDKFGKHYEGLKKVIENDPIKMAEIKTQHTLNAWKTQFQLPFEKKSHEATKNSAKSFENWEGTVNGAMGSVGAETNKMLGAMGGKPLAFGTSTNKASKTVKKVRGGEISIGAASGDSVPALLEKGEYVLNREAVSGVGVHKLNELNFGKHARFQEGGVVGDVGEALAAANSIDAQGFEYKWGGGHGGFEGPYDCSGAVSAVLHAAGLLSKPMVSGELASYGAPGPGPITIYANGVHAFMKIMGRYFGTSMSNPGGGAGWFDGAAEAKEGDSGGAFSVRHPTGVQAETLAKTILKGPEGKLKQAGQGAIEHVESAASKYLQAHMPGQFGGGDAALEGVSGPLPAMAAQIAKKGNSPHISTLSLYEALWAESSMGTAAPDNVLEALEPYTKIRPAAEEMSGFLYGKPEWTGTTAVSLANSGMQAYQIAQAVQKSGTGEASDGLSNYGAQQARAEASMKPFGLQSGGSTEKLLKHAGKAGKEAHKTGLGKEQNTSASMEKSISNTLKGIGEGKHLPKFNSHLKKIGRKIGKENLSRQEMNRLGSLTNEAAKFSEYASNASALTTTDEEGNVHQGVFKGGKEGAWLEQELTSLINLRKQVITSHELIAKKTLPHVTKLMKRTQDRLRKAQAAIRADEEKKRELKKQIQELEKVHNGNVQKIEKEKKELEHKLNQATNAKNPNQPAIKAIRDEIKSKNEAIGSDKKEVTGSIKADREKIQSVEADVNSQKRIETAASTLVGQLTDKRTKLYATNASLYGSGGEFEGTGQSFYGLEQIQGKGTGTGDIPNPPELGSVGGEIFGVQNRLREIQEELNKKPVAPAVEGQTEIEEMEKEIASEWKKKYEISQSQFSVLSGFPSVGAVASVPYAGNYGTGGLVAATVGERGREVVVMPTGSNVVANHDAKAAAGAMGGSHTFNFEELNIHEAEGKVSGRMNGQNFDQDVESINRKQARRSAPNTPGGRRRR